MNELLSSYAAPRNLRTNSTGGVKLNHPLPCNKFYGERDYSVFALRLLNSLPVELRLIRSCTRFQLNLINHLFIKYYLT